MSTDWREKEREFLTSLKADTGRDLGEWMRVIAAQNLPHRNDIIDWLRQHGFPFARASWLERIHHNQGRPIYLDPAELTPAASAVEAEAEGALQRVASGGSRTVFMAAPATTPAPTSPPVPARAIPPPRIAAEMPKTAAPKSETDGDASDDAAAASVSVERPAPSTDETPAASRSTVSHHVLDSGAAVAAPAGRGKMAVSPSPPVEEVLSKAKAYRPLALHLIRLIDGAVPDLKLAPGPGHLLLSTVGETPFGLIAISGKDIRLALHLSAEVACAPLGPVKLPLTLSRAAQGMTHMAVLTDARQLDEGLINFVRRAAGA
ncbi:MAG: hypothetical protein AB7U75_19660 [Hyphomicrobiaceae bacterium]